MHIRKFHSVNEFVERVRTLDTVLENIENFSSEASRINACKPNEVIADKPAAASASPPLH